MGVLLHILVRWAGGYLLLLYRERESRWSGMVVILLCCSESSELAE